MVEGVCMHAPLRSSKQAEISATNCFGVWTTPLFWLRIVLRCSNDRIPVARAQRTAGSAPGPGSHLLRAGLDRPVEDIIDVVNIEADGHGTTADALRAEISHVRKFVRKHDQRIAQLQFGVTDLSRGVSRHPHALLRPQNIAVELDR